jgi:hypothetical protein
MIIQPCALLHESHQSCVLSCEVQYAVFETSTSAPPSQENTTGSESEQSSLDQSCGFVLTSLESLRVCSCVDSNIECCRY